MGPHALRPPRTRRLFLTVQSPFRLQEEIGPAFTLRRLTQYTLPNTSEKYEERRLASCFGKLRRQSGKTFGIITPVTTPKKPSKEPSVPSQDEYRRHNMLMEQMLSKFDAFGEALSAVREDVNSMKPDLHAVKEDVAVLKAASRTHTDAIKANTEATSANTEAIRSMQTDLKNINQRLEVVEVKLAS